MRTDELEYSDITKAVDSLVNTLPDDYVGVVSINRGGLPIGVELSHRLNIPHGLVSAHSYDGADQGELTWQGGVTNHLPNTGSILLVDDIVDSGNTMEVAESYLCERFNQVDTAALHVKPTRSFDPDWFVQETDKWVVYPWENVGEPKQQQDTTENANT